MINNQIWNFPKSGSVKVDFSFSGCFVLLVLLLVVVVLLLALEVGGLGDGLLKRLCNDNFEANVGEALEGLEAGGCEGGWGWGWEWEGAWEWEWEWETEEEEVEEGGFSGFRGGGGS